MSPKKKALIAVPVAAALVAGGATAAYAVVSKSVEVTVEGETKKFRTFSNTVAEVLKDQKVTVRAGDKLNLDPGKELSSGDKIVVKYAKPIKLVTDGEVTEHKVFDPTVKAAYETLDVTVPSGAYASHKPSQKLDRAGETLVVSRAKQLVVVADGKKRKVTTNQPKVSDVLDEAGVKVGEIDEVKPGVDSYVKPKAPLRVVRIKKVTKTETVPTDYPVQVRKDSAAFVGEKHVVRDGVRGKKRERVTLVYADGKLRKRVVLASSVLKRAVAQIEERGTKKREASGVAAASPVNLSGVWARLAQCESGGNPRANNSGMYFGLYQFSISTWNSVGGTGNPAAASPAEQTKRAKILQARAGWGQWPACARKLGLL